MKIATFNTNNVNKRLPTLLLWLKRCSLTSHAFEAAVDAMLIACLYLPNGNPQPGPKFDYKMRWFSRLARHAAQLQKQDHPTLLVGDYNVAPTDLDIYPTKSWVKDALVQPAPRKAFASLVASGWTDALRDIFVDERVYTFWTYWRDRSEHDEAGPLPTQQSNRSAFG